MSMPLLDQGISFPELRCFRLSGKGWKQIQREACRYLQGSSASEKGHADLHLRG